MTRGSKCFSQHCNARGVHHAIKRTARQMKCLGHLCDGCYPVYKDIFEGVIWMKGCPRARG